MAARFLLLVTERNAAATRKFALPDGEYLLGRNERNHIVLPSDGVSRHHAKIVVRERGVTLMDLASTSGTYVNGRRVLRRDLGVYDEFRIAEFELKLTPATDDATSDAEVPSIEPSGEVEQSRETVPPEEPPSPPETEAVAPPPSGPGGTARRAGPLMAQATDTIRMERPNIPGITVPAGDTLSEEAEEEAAAEAEEETSDPFKDALGEGTVPMDFSEIQAVILDGARQEVAPPTAAAGPGQQSGEEADSGGGARVVPLPAGATGDMGTAPTDVNLTVVPETSAADPQDVASADGASRKSVLGMDTDRDPDFGAQVRAAMAQQPSSVKLVDDELGTAQMPPIHVRNLRAERARSAERLWLQQVEVLGVPDRNAEPPRQPPADVVAYLSVLQRLLHLASSAQALRELYEDFLELLWPHLGADVAVVFTLGESRVAKPAVVRTRERIPDGEVPVSRTVVDRATAEGVAMRCDDLRHDKRFEAGASLFLYNVRSVLAVPVIGSSGVRGLVYLHRGPGVTFEERDLDRMVTATQILALGVDRLESRATVDPDQVFRDVAATHLPPRAARAQVQRFADSMSRGDGLPSFALEPVRVVALCVGERGDLALRRTLGDEELARHYGELYEGALQVLRREEAMIVSSAGDALLALFPVEGPAADQALRRAVRAALEVRRIGGERIAEPRTAGLGVALDMGVADAGFVPVGDRLAYCAVGKPVSNVRVLLALARPGEVLLSDAIKPTLTRIVDAKEIPGRGTRTMQVFGLSPGASVKPQRKVRTKKKPPDPPETKS